MLEHLPGWIGSLLRDRRAGHANLVAADSAIGGGDRVIDLSSPAFANGARLPIRFTADGEGLSPPLVWGDVPAETHSLALIVEDPDAPVARPLVHAIAWNMPATERRIAEGAIVADGAGGEGGDVGRNSFLREGWLPPDPPPQHGTHDYVFQLFALADTADLTATPGRKALVDAIAGKVLATGILIGTYSRDEAGRADAPDSAIGPGGLAPA